MQDNSIKKVCLLPATIVKMKLQKWIYFKSALPESVFREKMTQKKKKFAASISFLKYNKICSMLFY